MVRQSYLTLLGDMMTYTFLEAFWCTYQNKQKSQFVCAVLDYVKRGFLRQK